MIIAAALVMGLLGILLAAAGGALWYFKFRKPSGGKGKSHMDDYGYDEDDEENEETEESRGRINKYGAGGTILSPHD